MEGVFRSRDGSAQVGIISLSLFGGSIFISDHFFFWFSHDTLGMVTECSGKGKNHELLQVSNSFFRCISLSGALPGE